MWTISPFSIMQKHNSDLLRFRFPFAVVAHILIVGSVCFRNTYEEVVNLCVILGVILAATASTSRCPYSASFAFAATAFPCACARRTTAVVRAEDEAGTVGAVTAPAVAAPIPRTVLVTETVRTCLRVRPRTTGKRISS